MELIKQHTQLHVVTDLGVPCDKGLKLPAEIYMLFMFCVAHDEEKFCAT